ncbi:hypothetical protein DPMN_038999 [Dreissena polymorpha]|uniref:Uncharacterized protein n=1 Tax=Dreissena polymorpha TaxID=45954 RepID=A0A9D4MFR4_DREPO|nr:hypothetical protein DPMN_038999 [Dreissena polymorpha]
MMEVTETKQECLAVYIQCWSPKAILKLCEDCVFGKLTALLKPVEKQLRKIHGYELVSLEIVIYWKDFMRCFETIGRYDLSAISTTYYSLINEKLEKRFSSNYITKS